MEHGSLQQYLAGVLSQGGSNALPYAEDVKWGVRQQLVDLNAEFPSLSVGVSNFTHNDGRVARLLRCEGTAPIYFQGRKYNIPLTIWLLEGYPRSPPRVFLTPTKDMIIKASHKMVDASGFVNTPYLQQWSFPVSNLRDLTHTLCIHFGQDPPLFAKPPNWKNDQAANAQAQANANANANANVGAGGSGFQAYNPMVGGAQNRPQAASSNEQRIDHGGAGTGGTSGSGVNQGGSNANNSGKNNSGNAKDATPPLEVFRSTAVDALLKRVVASFGEVQRRVNEQMDESLAEQAVLEERSKVLGDLASQLARERDKLDDSVHQYGSKSLELEMWLEKNRDTDKDIDLDNVFVPSDGFTRQALDAMAKDMAIDDAMYSLEQALLGDALEPEAYLKQVRTLARKQFYHRALCSKIASSQQQLSDVANKTQQQEHSRRRASSCEEGWELVTPVNK